MSNKKFKVLHEFTINRKESVEETTDNGDGTKTVKQVEKEVPHLFCLRRPSVNDYDEAELFQHGTVAEGIEKGLISESLLAKRLKNGGGVLSDKEVEYKDNLWKEAFEIGSKLKEIKDEDKEKEKESVEKLNKRLEEIKVELQNYATHESSSFSITAEARARNKTVIWWLIYLLHKKDGDTWTPFIKGDNYKQRMESYSDLDDLEGDEKTFTLTAINKAMLVVSYWFASGYGVIDAEGLKKLEEP